MAQSILWLMLGRKTGLEYKPSGQTLMFATELFISRKCDHRQSAIPAPVETVGRNLVVARQPPCLWWSKNSIFNPIFINVIVGLFASLLLWKYLKIGKHSMSLMNQRKKIIIHIRKYFDLDDNGNITCLSKENTTKVVVREKLHDPHCTY